MINDVTLQSEEDIEQDYINAFADQFSKSPYFTIVVEGDDDSFIFRQLEDICEDAPRIVDVIAVNGRNVALGVFNKLKNSDHIAKVLFIVDQDTWIHTGIPQEYQHSHIICTNGYSIENDIYLDRKLSDLMIALNVYDNFRQYLNETLEWYVLAINRILLDTVKKGDTLDIHPNAYFKKNLKKDLIILREHETFNTELLEDLTTNYSLKLRGKNLLNLAMWTLNGRIDASHKYNLKTLIEETVYTMRGENLNRIFNNAKNIAMQDA